MSAEISERLILDSMPQPVLAVGLKHQISYANFAAQEFFQRKPFQLAQAFT